MNQNSKRCGFVAIIGAPNAGKSTLLNALIGTKVSIVTHKAQTTRRRILGILPVEQTQIIFVDTPGLFSPQKVFEKNMVDSAISGLLDADIGLLLVDVSKKNLDHVTKLLELLPKQHPPLALILNKIDLVEKPRLLSISEKLNARGNFEQTFMISALKNSGLSAILSFLSERVPEGPWHFPEDQLTNLTDRQHASEVVREKLFLALHDELPYGLTVATENWEAFKDGSVKLSLTIYVEREQHKPIILGKNGSKIKHIGKQARVELEHLWGHPVHLFLNVKVKEQWTKRPELYSSLGVEMDN
ncbi:MAG: GTPase Era [Alphaproteobacteria bacterium]|nr:GTPase Era [Alphaproteobacteria bacterium]